MSVLPSAAHHAAALAVWPAAQRALGWPLALALTLAWLAAAERATRRQAVLEAQRDWEAAERGPRDKPSGDDSQGESLEWLNALLTCFWPRCLAPLLCRLAVHRLNPRLAAASRPGWLRELRVARASLGSAPPRLSRCRLRLLDGGAAAELQLRLDYAAGRDLRLQLEAVVAPALRIPLHATRLALSGEVRVTVAGLSPAFPWVSLLRVAFVAPPALELAVSPVAGAAGVPGVSRWLQAFASAALAAHAAEPAAKPLRLSARFGDAAPKARLAVTVHDARNLPVHAGADPFVRLGLHAATGETGVRRRGRDPRFGGQKLSFDVAAWDKARLRVDVLGWRPRGPPLHLGTALLDVRAARVAHGLRGDGTPATVTLRLAVPGPGPEGVDPSAPPGAAGELDIELSLLDLSRPDAPAPPPPLPPHVEGEGDAAGDVNAIPPLKHHAPDAADVPPRSAEGPPVRLDQLAALEAAEAAAVAAAAAAAAAAAVAAAAQQAAPPTPKAAAVEPPPPPPAEPAAAPEAEMTEAAAVAAITAEAFEEHASPPQSDPGPLADDSSTADTPASPAAFVSPFAVAASTTPPLFVLEVTVHRAEALVASVESDPYVRLTLGGSSVETGVRRRMIDPNFDNQRFTLRCRGWGARAASLRVAALGWLPRGAEPVVLGSAVLDLRSALLSGSLVADGEARPLRVALQGVPHGALLLSLAARELAEVPPITAPEEAPEVEPPPPPKPDVHGHGLASGAFHDVQLNVPGWAAALEADAATLAATGGDAPAAAAAATPQQAAVTRRASAPARQL